MKTKINWRNHLIEFIVVVIGILIAFQLNTFSSNRKQAKVIDMHLEQIDEETQFNKNSIGKAIQHAENNLALLDSVLSCLRNPNFNDYTKVNQMTFKLLNIGNVYLRKNAYKSLIESGDIRFVKDFDIKNKVINLYEYYVWVEGIEAIAIDNYKERFYPYVNEHLDLVQARTQAKAIYQNKSFVNAIATYRYTTKGVLEKYKECETVIDEYLAE